MVDYKLLADEDVGGDLRTAYEAMVVMTVDSTPKKLMTYVDIASEVGFTEASDLEVAVVAGSPAWVHDALQTRGLDVNDSVVQAQLLILVPQHEAAITAAGVVTEKKYPGLKEGYLSDARRKREEGKI